MTIVYDKINKFFKIKNVSSGDNFQKKHLIEALLS